MNINAQIQFLGDLLVQNAVISKTDLDKIKGEVSQKPAAEQEDFESLLLSRGLVTEEQLLKVYSDHLDIPYVEIDQSQIEAQAISTIPAKIANKNKLVAVKKDGQNLTVALRNPFDINVIDELRTITKCNIKPVIAKSESIEEAIKTHYGVGAETVEKLVEDIHPTAPEIELKEAAIATDLSEASTDSSMVNFVNQLLVEAFQQRATDIHVEPFADRLRVRYRIDGVLYEVKTPKDIGRLKDSIISRFKIMANLNIAEKRRPQDGRCMIKLDGQDVDLRFSSFPTLNGEGLSIRLLTRQSILFGLDQLGLNPEDGQKLEAVLSKPNGIVLVTGPTGCGKTTTLYASLNYLNDAKVNIVTLEDPVEYQLQGVNQIQTNPRVELTFAEGLRSILRQDPDVIMVGEIRDLETAQIAIRSALTGHLILSTLHTNDAISTITRLMDLGVEPYLVASTLQAAFAQRLVRVNCEKCRETYKPDVSVLKAFGLKSSSNIQFMRGKGCAECNETGFKGRRAIFELLFIDDTLRSLIVAGANKSDLYAQALKSGMKTLRDDGLDKVKQGITTLDEVLRIVE